MDVNIHKDGVKRVSRTNHGTEDSSMVHLDFGDSSVAFFVSSAQADILFPALQKVYLNVQPAEKT